MCAWQQNRIQIHVRACAGKKEGVAVVVCVCSAQCSVCVHAHGGRHKNIVTKTNAARHGKNAKSSNGKRQKQAVAGEKDAEA